MDRYERHLMLSEERRWIEDEDELDEEEWPR